MLVSFIIVAYNAEKVLNNSLNCLKKQDYLHKNIEVILVDSNSNDDTKKIMEYFKNSNKDYKRILVLDNPKKILPCGWNVALKEAKGDVIVRVDAHSTFPNNFITENVKEMEKGENIVGGKCNSVTYSNSRFENLLLMAEESLFGAGIADFRRKNKREYVSTLAFAMYRKKVFDRVGLYNENLARTEDNEMHYRMRKSGYKFLLSPNISTTRYVRSDFKGLIKQKYGNGKWIGITMYYSPKCFSIYHLVPLLFVLSIMLCILIAFLHFPLLLIILTILYVIFNIINLLFVIIKKGFKIEFLLLPFIILCLHISYGIGTFIGLLIGPFYKRKNQ